MATKGMVMEERNLRKTRTGKVVSNKMDKTIVVAVENNVKHPVIGKIVTPSEYRCTCLKLLSADPSLQTHK